MDPPLNTMGTDTLSARLKRAANAVEQALESAERAAEAGQRSLVTAERAAELVEQIGYEVEQLRATDGEPRRRALVPKRRGAPVSPVPQLMLHREHGGKSRLFADNLPPIALSPRLTELVRFAAGGAADERGIVSARLVSDAAKALKATTKAVINLVHRLRRRLDEFGWDSRLVDLTRARTGARLRFRTGKLVVIEVE